MKKYTIINCTTKEILRQVTCSENSAAKQINNDEILIEGHYSSKQYKIVDGIAVELTETEKEDVLYNERISCHPPYFDITLTDEELNAAIEEYYLNRVNAEEWRIANYVFLRKLSYPDFKGEFLDGMVKISKGTSSQQPKGQAQLEQYYADCLAVKQRFPKE